MLSCVYKITFGKNAFDLNEEYDRLSEYEKERISDLDAEAFFDCGDSKDRYVCYVITKPLEMKSYTSILNSNLIEHKFVDLSKDILSNKVDLEMELSHQLTTTNSIKYSYFIDELNEWIYKNLDMDTVLDRISESGMDSLKDVEKLFLNNYNEQHTGFN